MSDQCNHDCENCSSKCPSGIEKDQPNVLSTIDKVYAVVSGKGGVGKSLVTGLLAVEAQKKGFRAAILDADITGPSVPRMFGATEPAQSTPDGILPVTSAGGVQIISINNMLEDETDPVIWRGPMIAGVVKQFWTDVIWQDVDYMFVDMPPGTGDVPLTVMQSLPVDGIIVVTSPQELVGMIVQKAVKMAEAMKVPVVGLVENMSYYTCPDCGKQHAIFGESKVEEVAKEFQIPHTAKLPIDPVIATMVDAGEVESVPGGNIAALVDDLEKELPLK